MNLRAFVICSSRFFWPPSRSERFPADLAQVEPITSIYLIRGRFDAVEAQCSLSNMPLFRCFDWLYVYPTAFWPATVDHVSWKEKKKKWTEKFQTNWHLWTGLAKAYGVQSLAPPSCLHKLLPPQLTARLKDKNSNWGLSLPFPHSQLTNELIISPSFPFNRSPFPLFF